MARYSISFGHPTLVDRLLGRGLGVDLVLIAVGVASIGVAAQLVVPMWPLPITGQTFAVLAVGSALGALRGVISTALYAAGGLLGLPIFGDGDSGVEIFGDHSGGYILGFIGAAAFVGWMAQRGADRSFARALVVASTGIAIIYLVGLPWLAVAGELNLSQALSVGLYPYLPGEAFKVLLVATLNAVCWAGMARMELREQERLVPGSF